MYQRSRVALTALAVLCLTAVGCAASGGVSRYQAVDLAADLSPADLARYRQEMMLAAGQPGSHVTQLEKANGWPLGLLAYWRAGEVQAVHAGGDMNYMVTTRRGYGPFSVLLVSEQRSLYDSSGRRAGATESTSILWGHLAMFHTMESKVEDSWHRHSEAHLLHHLVNWSGAHGQESVYLLSAPNPVGVSY